MNTTVMDFLCCRLNHELILYNVNMADTQFVKHLSEAQCAQETLMACVRFSVSTTLWAGMQVYVQCVAFVCVKYTLLFFTTYALAAFEFMIEARSKENRETASNIQSRKHAYTHKLCTTEWLVHQCYGNWRTWRGETDEPFACKLYCYADGCVSSLRECIVYLWVFLGATAGCDSIKRTYIHYGVCIAIDCICVPVVNYSNWSSWSCYIHFYSMKIISMNFSLYSNYKYMNWNKISDFQKKQNFQRNKNEKLKNTTNEIEVDVNSLAMVATENDYAWMITSVEYSMEYIH